MTTPPRRWFRFSLRTLFVAVTVVCVWLGYQLNWIRQRRVFREQQQRFFDNAHDQTPFLFINENAFSAPGLLWMLGERGVLQMNLICTESNRESELELAKRLFPEAEFEIVEDEAAGETESSIDDKKNPFE